MSTFAQTVFPTPYGFFDSDAQFQLEADGVVTFVKRKLGDDILSVELTKKQIWACLEEATLEFGNFINQYNLRSELANLLGISQVFSGTIVNGQVSASYSISTSYPRRTFEFLMRQAEPYSMYANVGGAFDTYLAYLDLEAGRQDYNIYSELKRGDGAQSGSLFFNTVPSSSNGKLRVLEVMHFSPLAAQHFLLNASNVTNFLATEFNYESYVNSTVFYVLPVFEDVLRRGMLETAYRVRRSHYSYQLIGRNLRIYPIPNTSSPTFVDKLYLRVATAPDPTSPAFNDSSISGVSNPAQAPFTNIQFSGINDLGKQWIRQYALALAKELLGLVRSKFDNIPIPNATLQLNGKDLIQQAREDKDKLHTELKDLIESLTYDKLLEIEAQKAENINTQLKYIPMIKPIIIG